MLLLHWLRAAASRTFWTAGSSRPIRMAMIAITTSSSISVNPRLLRKRNRNIPHSSPMCDEREKKGLKGTPNVRLDERVGGHAFRGRGPVGDPVGRQLPPPGTNE